MNPFAPTVRHHGGPAIRVPFSRAPARGAALPLLLLVGASCGAPATHGPATGTPPPVAPVASVPTEQFVGEWEGVYYSHPHLMGLALTLRQTGPIGVEGEVRFHALREARGIARAAEGDFTVRGTYDPVLRTFSLAPADWTERPRQGGRPFPIEGVFDPGQPALAGRLSYRPNERLFFTLTRPDRAGDLTRRAALNPPRARGGHMPDDDGLIEWVSRIFEEHPDVDPSTPTNQLLELGANLFEDEYFRTHFGKTYDLLSGRERNAVHRRFERTRPRLYGGGLQRLRNRNPNEELRELNAFRRAFDESAARGAYHIVHMVLAQRVIRAWREGQLARVAAMPATSDTFEELDRVAAVGEANLRTLWPSEQADFQQTVVRTRQRLAVPVLAAIVDELVGAAPTYDAAIGLASWQQGRNDLLAAVPVDLREAHRERITARLNEVLDSLVSAEVAGLADLGSGLAAVEAGNRWLADLQRRYAFAAGHPVLERTVAHLQERRPSDLAAARAPLAERIHTLTTIRAVDDFVRSTLAVPGDHDTDAGRALLQAAADRTRVLDRAAFLARFSPNEQRLLGDRDRIAVGPTYGPPDPDDVQRAVLRAFVDAGGRWVDRNTVTYGLSFLRGRFDWYVAASVTSIQVLNSAPPYTVAVSLHFNLTPSPEMDAFFGNSIQGQILRELMRLAALSPGSMTHTYALTPDGWKSAPLTQELATRNFSLFQPLFDAIW